MAALYFAVVLFIAFEWYKTDSFVNKLYFSTPIMVENLKRSAEQVRPYGYNVATYAINVKFIFVSITLYWIIGLISTLLFNAIATSNKTLPVILLISSGIVLCAMSELIHYARIYEARFACSIINFIGYILGLLTGMVFENYAHFKRTKEKGEGIVFH